MQALIAKTAVQANVNTGAATPSLAIPYGLHAIGGRPSAGSMLFAFTHAWLSLSGMAAGKAYPVAQAKQVAGDTAIAYHLKCANFEREVGMLKITKKGQDFFGKKRVNDASMVQAYVDVMQTGRVNAVVKNADYIRRVQA